MFEPLSKISLPPGVTFAPVAPGSAFPAGARFSDVDGIPFAEIPVVWGDKPSVALRAFDTDPPRPFSANRVREDGKDIDEATFLSLVKAFQTGS